MPNEVKANQGYPGQMVRGDTKRLPLLKGQRTSDPRKYLFLAADDFSREPLMVDD